MTQDPVGNMIAGRIAKSLIRIRKQLMLKLTPTYPVPDRMPNGLQWTEEGLYVMDQFTDLIYVLGDRGKVIRLLPNVTENGSGITVGGGYIWTGSNGRTVSRPFRSTDTHLGWILKLDIKTGELVDRYRTPDGGGIHGVEWEPETGLIWVTAFNPKALILCDPEKNFKVVRKFQVELPRLHGLAIDGDGIWCAHTGVKIIVKYDRKTGKEMDRITFPPDGPAPHGLSIKDGVLWYCDANFPDANRAAPEIGMIVRSSTAASGRTAARPRSKATAGRS
ncbi:MAG: SMP-30/gluconolactonase/LRE family protein [SAR202 cluster bacterium]|nr:SMP-30/gluconolactonase/LRE family protein [SAR202 cluster bacterium]